MSSSAIYAGLDFQPACPGIVAELLAIETMFRPFQKGPHSEPPIPSGKSGGAFLPCQNYLHHAGVFCKFCVVVVVYPLP